ncbi:hypothetical protein SAMN05216266_11590 [Amycolatopsis marina]|uniref:EfeO-type cupredoxin-like domain-containing protein n=1 Tax=Amycolatopsis marina TaxID=490629 RepID=A0A1I1BLX9_9PSEU|nr:hypothetical protein [Amycolatopsis marina]SFB51414.1 hypothetical protein SAMN05216266_11590 [Amycolatopsis marina]
MRRPLLTLAACALALTACGGSPGEVTDAGPSAPERPASVTESADAGETSQAAAPPVAFAVTDGARTEGPDTVEVSAGDTVSFEVTSDVADELHIHGYDKTLDLAPGEPGRLEFTADIPGSFEVELHEQGLLLTQLRVGG